MANNAQKICDLFASRKDVARAAQLRSLEAVSRWKVRNAIPHKRRLLLLKNCSSYGVDRTELFGLLLADYLEVIRNEK